MLKWIYFVFLLSFALHVRGQDSAFDQLEKEASQKGHFVKQASSLSLSANNIHYLQAWWTSDPNRNYIKGLVKYYVEFLESDSAFKLFLAYNLQVDSAKVNGIRRNFQHRNNDELSILSTFSSNQSDTIEIYYQGSPEQSGFGGFTTSQHASGPVQWTLSQPFAAKEWWPNCNCLNDKIDSADIYIQTPLLYEAVSNGSRASVTFIDTALIYHWRHRYPIASYLVAYAISNYSISSHSINLNGTQLYYEDYLYPQDTAIGQVALERTTATMLLFQNLFGEYPFIKEKYGHTQCGFSGGMEHQTNSFMNNFNEGLIAHELGHQWFGDKVTCNSWSDIWLNEGIATYLTFLIHDFGRNPNAWENYKRNATFQITAENGGSVYVEDTSNISRIFDYRLSYLKGSYLLHMLRWQLGDSLFFAACRNYLNNASSAFGFSSTQNFKFELEQAYKAPLDNFFNDWYYGEGFPTYGLQWRQLSNEQIFIKLNQTSSHPSVSFFEMPVPIQLKGNNIDTSIVLQHAYTGQEFLLNVPFGVDTIVMDPEQWILCRKAVSNLDEFENFEKSIVSVQPNPSSTKFELRFNKTQLLNEIQIYYNDGRLRNSITLDASPRISIEINCEDFEQGYYIVRLQTIDRVYSVPVIIMK